jgi:hypothetical protein
MGDLEMELEELNLEEIKGKVTIDLEFEQFLDLFVTGGFIVVLENLDKYYHTLDKRFIKLSEEEYDELFGDIINFKLCDKYDAKLKEVLIKRGFKVKDVYIL